jgi:short-subunit dehydrogenase
MSTKVSRMPSQGYALVTGASSGIGEEFARQLAERGWPLILVARSQDRLASLHDQLIAAHAVDVRCVAMDLTAPGAPLDLFEKTQADALKITLLINNAGFGGFGEFAGQDRERLLQMIELNITALVELTHLYLRAMYRQSEAQRGSSGIINIASVAGFMPLPYSAVYAATKAFVLSFSQALAEEASQHGVRIMAVNPGTTKTNFFEVAGKSPFSNTRGMQTAAQVVSESLRAFERGRRSVITGASNRTTILLTELIPRRWITALVGRVMRRTLANRSKGQ